MSKRFSAQRERIQAALAALDHPTAAQVYDHVRIAYPQISLGTVYRNLSTMAAEGQVLRLSFPSAPDRFDCNTAEHCHAACQGCGRIFDTDDTLPAQLLTQLDAAVEQATGIRVEARVMLFRGWCADCRTTH